MAQEREVPLAAPKTSWCRVSWVVAGNDCLTSGGGLRVQLTQRGITLPATLLGAWWPSMRRQRLPKIIK